MYLQEQIDELIALTGPPDSHIQISPGTIDRLVELIRSIAETLLWGEQNEEDSLMFDNFAERGVMKIFVSLLNSASVPNSYFSPPQSTYRQVMIQLLQTMSLLLLNVKRRTSLYFVLSNNAINQLINNNLDFSDEEILSYYVSLMKSISLRLSEETIHFFINDKTPNNFPLFTQSIRFFDHHDRMVRIAVRTITLAIFRLRSEILSRFLSENSGAYFSLLACQLRDLWFLIDRTPDERTVKTIVDEMVDQLEYIAEIFRLDLPALSVLLQEKLELYALKGVLLKGLLQIQDEGSDSPRLDDESALPVAPSKILSFKLSLYVLVQLMDILDCDISQQLVTEFLASQEAKNRMETDIKSISSAFNIVSVFLGRIPGSASSECMLFLAQSLGRAIEAMSLRSCQIVLQVVRECLSRDNDEQGELRKAVKRQVNESFKKSALRISQMIGDTLLRSSQSCNEMNYAVIDDFELVLGSLAHIEPFKISPDDVGLLLPIGTEWEPAEQPVIATRDRLRVFFTFLHGLRCIDDANYSLAVLNDDLFGPSKSVWFDAEEINSPPTPPLEMEDGTTSVTGPLDEEAKEGDLIDLGKRDRIFCHHINSDFLSGKAARYLILDNARLILVSPDLTRPGHAWIKFLEPLRQCSSIEVKRDDNRTLVLSRANPRETDELMFDDVKRCHLALMHLETKRMDLRKNMYARIDALLRSLVHQA